MLRTLLLVLAALAAPAFAGTTDVTRETEGYGATQQEATTNALVEAVRQVRGTTAGSDRTLQENVQVVVTPGGGAASAASTPANDVYAQSRGLVRSYETLELRPTDKGYYVRIRAVVPTFTSDVADDGRKLVVVVPFRIDADAYRLRGHGEAAAFGPRLAAALNAQLANSKAVVVLSRDQLAAMGAERLLLAADAPPAELLKTGQLAGADWLFTGTVRKAKTEREEGPYGSAPKVEDELGIDWQLVESATGKLVAAGTLDRDYLRPNAVKYSWSKDKDEYDPALLFNAVARDLMADALKAAGLAAADAATTVPATATPVAAPVAPLTPGSSEAPLRW